MSPHPSPIRVQGSLIVGQTFFGLGSVIAYLGLPECNPFAFAFYREICAGLILWTASQLFSGGGDDKTIENTTTLLTNNWKRFVLLGLTIFGNQGCVFAGIKLAGPVVAAIWQPSQPIFTATISMIFQWEPSNKIRISGVALAFLGCAGMILLGETSSRGDVSGRTTLQKIVGHCLFFINCLCASLYVILSKKPLRKYPSLTVVAWAYNFAAMFMATAAWLVSLSSVAMDLFCPECDTWKIPSGAILPLVYFILFNSVVAHAMLTWANQFATGTLVMGFTVLQPTTAALVTVVLLSMGYPNCQTASHPCLEGLGWSSILGMIGVVSGLALVIVTEPADETDEPTKIDDEKVYEQMPEEEII